MKYVIGDVHGNSKRFRNMLYKIGDDCDELYLLGDVIDRGDHGIDILRWAMKNPDVHMLLGNHEYMMLDALGFPYADENSLISLGQKRLFEKGKENEADHLADESSRERDYALDLWYYNGGEVTHNNFRKLSYGEQTEMIHYLLTLPTNREIVLSDGRKIQLCHANIPEVYRTVRSRDSETFFCVWDRENQNKLHEFDDRTIIYGHTPTMLLPEGSKFNPAQVINRGSAIDLDCGAAYKFPMCRLAAVRLEDMKIIYSDI